MKKQSFLICVVLSLTLCILQGCHFSEHLEPLSASAVLPKDEIASYMKHARAGDAKAAKRVAEHFAVGVHDGESSYGWYQLAARLGDPESEFILGYLLAKDGCSEREQELGFWWMNKGAKDGEPGAQAEVKLMREGKVEYPGMNCIKAKAGPLQ